MNFNDFSAQDGSENGPKLAQDHSKTVPKEIIFHVEFWLQFWSVLASILAPISEPFWTLFGIKIGPSSVQDAFSSSIFFKNVIFTKTFKNQ